MNDDVKNSVFSKYGDLTDKDCERLIEYSKKIKKLEKEEPRPAKEWMSEETYNATMNYLINGEGEPTDEIKYFIVEEIPEYDTGKTKIEVYEKEWISWHNKITELHLEYHDEILRAYRYYEIIHDKIIEMKKVYNEEKIINDIKKKMPKRNFEVLRTILPHSITIPNHKLVYELDKVPIIKDVEQDVLINAKVGTDEEENKIITSCTIVFTELDENIKSSKPFGKYDRLVFNAVVSLYDHENLYITPASVYRTMANLQESQDPSPQQKGAVTKALNKMRHMDITIDGEEELRARGEDCSIMYEGYLLPLEKVTLKAGGRVETAYKIISEPCLYTYSKVFKQFIKVESKMLDIYEITDGGDIKKDENGEPIKLKNTPDRMIIKEYLIREIHYMKAGRNKKILIDTLYENTLENPNPSDKKKRTTREYAESCLKSWTKTGYIKGYERVTKFKEITGIKIIL